MVEAPPSMELQFIKQSDGSSTYPEFTRSILVLAEKLHLRGKPVDVQAGATEHKLSPALMHVC